MARLCDPRFEAAVAHVAPGAVCDGAGVWRLALSNGSVASVEARITTGWVRLVAPLAPESALAGDLESLLLNSELSGVARLVRGPHDGQLRIRADVPIEPDTDLSAALASACLDVAAVRHAAHRGREYRATSWTPDQDAGRGIATQAGTFHTQVEQWGSQRRVLVELAELAGHTHRSMRAVSLLLMRLGACVPDLTTALHEGGRHLVAVAAAPLRTPHERDLARALGVVSAACELSARELRALRQLDVANTYLSWKPRAVQEEQTCMQP